MADLCPGDLITLRPENREPMQRPYLFMPGEKGYEGRPVRPGEVLLLVGSGLSHFLPGQDPAQRDQCEYAFVLCHDTFACVRPWYFERVTVKP